MIIDGKKAKEPLTNYYYFNDTESHEIYILINMEKYGNSLVDIFYYVNRMISISFTSLFNTSNITSMKFFFDQCSKLESINNFYNLDIRKVEDMSFFFRFCSSLKSINLSNFDTKNVKDLRGMFYGCSKLISINLSNFDTKNVTNLNSMFYNCSALTSIDLSNFYTKTSYNIANIFFYCKDLKFINIANLNTTSTISLFNGILGKNGTIIANQNIYNNMNKASKDSIVGWTQL